MEEKNSLLLNSVRALGTTGALKDLVYPDSVKPVDPVPGPELCIKEASFVQIAHLL